MRRSDEGASASPKAPDLLALAAVIWALCFGILYAEMIVRARVPQLAAAIRRSVGVAPCNWLGMSRY